MTILLQLSAAQGPLECRLAVKRALERLLLEAQHACVEADIVEQEDGERPETLRSVLVRLEGDQAEKLAERWEGTVQWICPSPYRPNHGRKNWFIGVSRCAALPPTLSGEIRFETCRASGPGGQHVNRTESAVRATHTLTGISVRVQSERSQHANKRIATLLIAHRLEQRTQAAESGQREQRRMMHYRVERGKAGLVFRGEGFEPS